MSILQLFGQKHQIPSCNIQTNSNHTNPNDAIRERFWENWSLELGILRADLQPDWVSCFKAPRQPIGACEKNEITRVYVLKPPNVNLSVEKTS
jgi:hypothetical protein